MNKQQLARQLARESRITTAAAADQLDRILNEILQRVRKGERASLPGLGTFAPGRDREFQFDAPLFGPQRGKARKAAR